MVNAAKLNVDAVIGIHVTAIGDVINTIGTAVKFK